MRLAFGFPLFLHLADSVHHPQRRFAGFCGVAGFLVWRAPESHHCVANVLVERAVIVENEAGHVRKILVQEKGQFLRVEFFGDGGEAPNVAEHNRDFSLLRLYKLWIDEQTPDDFRAEILAEGRADAALFFFLKQ